MKKKIHYTSTILFAKFKKFLPKQNLKITEKLRNICFILTEFFPKNLIKKSSKEDVRYFPEILSVYHVK